MNALKSFKNILAFAIIAVGLQASLASAQSVSLNYSSPVLDSGGFGSLDVGSQLNPAPGYTANFTDGAVTFNFTAPPLPGYFWAHYPLFYDGGGAYIYEIVEPGQSAQVTVGATSTTSNAPQFSGFTLLYSDGPFNYSNYYVNNDIHLRLENLMFSYHPKCIYKYHRQYL